MSKQVNDQLTTEQVSAAAAYWNCIRYVVPGSDLCCVTNCSDYGFPESVQVNARIVPLNSLSQFMILSFYVT
jgi:hypothetical protein